MLNHPMAQALNIATGLLTLTICLAASYMDLRRRIVPNWLTLPAIPLGIVLNTLTGGAGGAVSSLACVIICGGLFFALFWLGGMGAGDVKLMAAVAALASWPAAIYAMVYTAVAGGIIAIVILARKGRLFATMKGMFRAATYIEAKKAADAEREDEPGPDGAKRLYIPYAPAIAIGTFWALL
jgi:prepilin peptidase CpaA